MSRYFCFAEPPVPQRYYSCTKRCTPDVEATLPSFPCALFPSKYLGTGDRTRKSRIPDVLHLDGQFSLLKF